MRFPPANIQLRRAQLIMMLAVLLPTVLMVGVGIVLLVIGGPTLVNIVIGVLVLTLCTSAITGYILATVFVGKGASLARVQNDFLSSVSHELRTPLTSIGLFITSLRDGRLSLDDQKYVLELLGREVTRLESLVQRLLELSRMESGRHPFERSRVDVGDVVREAVSAFDAATLTRPTRIAVDVEPGLAMLGDRATLIRAVSNLLINAWKYTGEDKQISVQARGAGRKVEITVEDNGIGVVRGEQRDIFDEFARGRDAIERGTPGEGLGLAFVRAIARAHKGKILVLPRERGGSAFQLRLKRGLKEAERSVSAVPAKASRA